MDGTVSSIIQPSCCQPDHETSIVEFREQRTIYCHTRDAYLNNYDLGVKIKQCHVDGHSKKWGKEDLYYRSCSCKSSDYRIVICDSNNKNQDGAYKCHYPQLPYLNLPLLSTSLLSTSLSTSSPAHTSCGTLMKTCVKLNGNNLAWSQNNRHKTAFSVFKKKYISKNALTMSMIQTSSIWIESIFLVMFLANVPSISLGEPVKVHIHAIIPSHFAMTTELSREFHNTMLNFRRDHRNQRFRSLFNPDGDITFLNDDSPKEIMNAFCNGILENRAITLLNINNPLGIRRRTSSNEYVLELANYLGIPILSWDSQFSDISLNQRTLQMAPTIEHQAMAMISLLERYNWTSFNIVTSQVAGDAQFVNVINRLVEHRQRKAAATTSAVKRENLEILSTVHIRHLSEVAEMLKKLVGTDARVFLLHCSSRASYEIIETAVRLGLTGRDYIWILTRSSIPPGKFGTDSFPVGLLGISFDYDLEVMKRVIRSGVKMWLYALLNMFKMPVELSNRTVIPQFTCKSTADPYWKDGDIIYRHLMKVIVRDEPQIEFNQNGTLKSTELIVVNLQWHDGPRNKTEWKEVGRWTRFGLTMADITWPGESSVPPTGKPKRAFLRVSTLNELPYVIYRMPQDDGTCEEKTLPCQIYLRDENKEALSNVTVSRCCTGLSMDLLKILSSQLNFDFMLTEVKDGKWGSINKVTKTWNGLVQVLLDDQADVVVTALKINPERAQAVRFSVPYLETGIKIIVALRDGVISPTAFLEPYDYASWSLILVFSVHATGSSILIFEWLSPYGLNRGHTPMRDHRFSLFRSFWLIWSMLFSTSVSTISPKGIASRFLANIWALFAMVFLASYTANLAAFMITKEVYYDLSGIQDYRLQNPYTMNPPFKYATIPNGSTEANIRANHKDMFNYMKPYNQPDVDAGIAALKKGTIQAFIYDSSVLEYYASRDPQCRLLTVGNRYAMTGYGVGFRTDIDNSWIDKFNRVILKLQQSGELDRLQKFWLAGACRSKKDTSLANRTLGILNFTSAFILLGTGVLLGLVILCIEHIYFLFWRKHLKALDKCGCCSLVSLSVGKSLQSCEDGVLDVTSRGRCRDPHCEAQIWKLQHQLDMALMKIDTLVDKLSWRGYETLDVTSTASLERETNLQQRIYTIALKANGTGRRMINTHGSSINECNDITYNSNPSPSILLKHATNKVTTLHELPQRLVCSSVFDVQDEAGNQIRDKTEHYVESFNSADTSLSSDNLTEPSLPPPPLGDSPLLVEDNQDVSYDIYALGVDNYCDCTYSTVGAFECNDFSAQSESALQCHGSDTYTYPVQKLRRTPSYASAIGSTLNSDLIVDTTMGSGKVRQFEGKKYSGIDNSKPPT